MFAIAIDGPAGAGKKQRCQSRSQKTGALSMWIRAHCIAQ